MTYPIIQVPLGASSQLEQLGNKYKFWYREDEHLMLFKEGRPGTGENWAEKVCCEIARELGLPHAEYDFAIYEGKDGVVTPSIVPDGGRLIHGNEVLARVYEDYDEEQRFRARQHTLRRVMAVVRSPAVQTPLNWKRPEAVANAAGVFAGYLLLDALVAGQDRHHQNWGLISLSGSGLSLAPTYDHASSLGRNETDARRVEALTTRDRGRSVAHYATRAMSALYETQISPKPLKTLEAFTEAAKIEAEASIYWLERLELLSLRTFQGIFDEIPPNLISKPAIDFAVALLTVNRERLLSEGRALK